MTNGALSSRPAGRELSAGIETASGLWVPEGSAVEMPYVAGPEADTGQERGRAPVPVPRSAHGTEPGLSRSGPS